MGFDEVTTIRGKDGIVREIRRRHVPNKIVVRDDGMEPFERAEWSLDQMGFDVDNLFPNLGNLFGLNEKDTKPTRSKNGVGWFVGDVLGLI